MNILNYIIENPTDLLMFLLISSITIFIFYDVLKRYSIKKENKKCKCSNCKCGKSDE
jgi:phosphatidylglycerophosphatase A